VPISEELQAEINMHAKNQRTETEKLFESCYSAFLGALERTSIQLPNGQASHVLRHTFASHFMINGGNILTLQRVLGHANLTMTMRYAHLVPDHLQEVLSLNPLAKKTPGRKSVGNSKKKATSK
jgi:site-specific recombinase XerD